MKIILMTVLVLAGCASHRQLDRCITSWETQCYVEAKRTIIENHKNDKKLKAEAVKVFEKGCEKNHAMSCTDASFHTKNKKNLNIQIKYATKACRLGDELGCYNLGCYYCRQNKVKKTLKALEKSFKLGAKDWKSRLKDPDLKCLGKNHRKLLKNWSKEELDNAPMSVAHTFIPLNSSSTLIPHGFVALSLSPLLMVHKSGAMFIHLFTSRQYLSSIKKFAFSDLKNKKIILEKIIKKNSFKTYVWLVEGEQKGKKIKKLLSLSQLPEGDMMTSAIYPDYLEMTLGKEMTKAVLTSNFNINWKNKPPFESSELQKLRDKNYQYIQTYDGYYTFSVQKSFEVNQSPDVLFFKLIDKELAKEIDSSKEGIKKLFSLGYKIFQLTPLEGGANSSNLAFFKLYVMSDLSKEKSWIYLSLKKKKDGSIWLIQNKVQEDKTEKNFMALVQDLKL